MKRIFICVSLILILSGAGLAQRPGGKRQHRFGRKMAMMDKNGDGRISRDEWMRKPKKFDRLDLNHDGVITPEEVREAHRARRPGK